MSKPSTDGSRPDAPNIDDMLMIHASFRREFELGPGLVRQTRSPDTRRARLVEGHLRMMLKSLHDHHAGEDAVLWPALRATGKVEPHLLDEMLDEHHQLAEQLADADRLLPAWAAEPSESRTEHLATVLERVGREVAAHLEHEENRALPLVGAYLTSRDWQVLSDESRRKLPKNPRVQLMLLGVLLEDATPDQRNAVQQEMPTAARWLWLSVGRLYYRRYVNKVRG